MSIRKVVRVVVLVGSWTLVGSLVQHGWAHHVNEPMPTKEEMMPGATKTAQEWVGQIGSQGMRIAVEFKERVPVIYELENASQRVQELKSSRWQKVVEAQKFLQVESSGKVIVTNEEAIRQILAEAEELKDKIQKAESERDMVAQQAVPLIADEWADIILKDAKSNLQSSHASNVRSLLRIEAQKLLGIQ